MSKGNSTLDVRRYGAYCFTFCTYIFTIEKFYIHVTHTEYD